MTTTLGTLIEDGDFSGYMEMSATFLDATDIEFLLYKRPYCGYAMGEKHFSSFCQEERLTAINLRAAEGDPQSTFGLHLLRLKGIPIALSRQEAPRTPRELVLLSPLAQNEMAERWETHRPPEAAVHTFIDPVLLGLPIAALEDLPIDLDTDAPIHRMRPSLQGVEQWLDAIQSTGGLAAQVNQSTLTLCLQSARAQLVEHRGILESHSRISDGLSAASDESHLQEARDAQQLIIRIENNIIAPIEKRLAELEKK